MLDQQGHIDILVNNAGITIDKTHAKLTDDDWHEVLAVNLSGAFFLAQAVLPHMIERGSGRIVNVSSIIGEIGVGKTRPGKESSPVASVAEDPFQHEYPHRLSIRIVAGQSIISGRVLLQCRSAARSSARRMRRAAVCGHSRSGFTEHPVCMFKSRLWARVAVAFARDHLRGASQATEWPGLALPRPQDTLAARLAAVVQAVWPHRIPQVQGRGVGPHRIPTDKTAQCGIQRHGC